MKSILILLLPLCFSTGLAEGNWQTQTSGNAVRIAYTKDIQASGFPSFTAAVESSAKTGDVSRLTSIDITVLMAVDKELDKEIKALLQHGWPDELKAAQRSTGNMHNPALRPIYKPFLQCLLQTSLMKEIEGALNQHGLKLEPVFIEKFSFVDRDGFRPFWGFAYLQVEPSRSKLP